MIFAAFTSESAARAFDAAVSARMGWPNGFGTTHYADPVALTDGRWAMPVEAYASADVPPGTSTIDEATMAALRPTVNA